MKKILWLSTCCVHDLASEAMLQVRNMIGSLVDRGANVVCLSSTIRSNDDPNSLHPVARELILHSSNKFQFADASVQYIYTTTKDYPLASMTTLEQSQFYQEMTPIICGFKPDMVITSASDIVAMSCLNLAKSLDIPTVFALIEPPASEFDFNDVDLIVSSSQALTNEYVSPKNKKALQIGPFVCPNGPIMDIYFQAKQDHLQALAKDEPCKDKAQEDACIGDGKALTGACKGSAIDWVMQPFPNIADRKLILMVSPNVEHGLGLFLGMVEQCTQDKFFKDYEFAVLETEDNQFLLNANAYNHKNQEKAAFSQDLLNKVTVFGVGNEINELLVKSRVLIMPTLSLVSNSSLGIQSLSHGVPIITTEQDTLKEQLKEAARYIEVDQELIDDLYLAPDDKQVLPWAQTLKEELANPFDPLRIWGALEHCDYIAGCRRLALAIKPLLDKRAGDNPQLLRLGAYSLRSIIQAEIEAQKKEAIRAANSNSMSDSIEDDTFAENLKELMATIDTSSYSALTDKHKQAYSTQAPALDQNS